MKYSSCKDINSLIKSKIALGWTYEGKGGSKHSKIIAPNGRRMPVPLTPGDGRSIRNFRSQLKRLEAM